MYEKTYIQKRSAAMPRTIREIRKEKGLSANYVAGRIGMKTHLYLRRENGKTEWKANEFKNVCNVLEVSTEEVQA